RVSEVPDVGQRPARWVHGSALMNLKDPALIEERIILRKATTWLMLVLKQPSPDGLDAGPRPSSAHSRNAARRVDRSDHGGGHVRHHVPVRPAMAGRGRRRLLGDRVDPPQAAQAAAIATLRLIPFSRPALWGTPLPLDERRPGQDQLRGGDTVS